MEEINNRNDDLNEFELQQKKYKNEVSNQYIESKEIENTEEKNEKGISNYVNDNLSNNKEENLKVETVLHNNLSEKFKSQPELHISENGTVKIEEKVDIIDDIINRIGINYNNSILFIILSLFFLADGAEMILISLIVNKIEQLWKLTSFEKSLLGASVFTGFYAGALIGGKLSSNIGRKFSFVLGAIFVFIFGIISSFSMNFPFLAICRAILGLGVGISLPASSSLLAEVTPVKYRSLVLSIISIAFPFGEIMIVAVAKNIYISHPENWWKILLFISPFPILLCLILSFITFESPRYLLVKGKYSELIEIFNSLLKNVKKPILTKTEEDNIIAMSELKKLEDKLKHKELIDANFDLNEAKEQEMESEILDENLEKQNDKNIENIIENTNNNNNNNNNVNTNNIQNFNNDNNHNNINIYNNDEKIENKNNIILQSNNNCEVVKEVDWEYELVKLKNKPHDLMIIKVKELNEKLDNDKSSNIKSKQNLGYSALLTSKYFKLSFHCSVLFFVNSFVYYGLIYILPQSFNSHIVRNSNLAQSQQNITFNNTNLTDILNSTLLLNSNSTNLNSNNINNNQGFIQSNEISNLNNINSSLATYINSTSVNSSILNSSYYSDELFDNLLISCLSEIPASLATVVVADLKFIGRKDALLYSFLITGISSFVIIVFSNSIFVMSTSMKFFISISFAMNYIYVAEAYPTKVRAIALAFCNSFTRLAGVVSPLILQVLFNNLHWLPYLAFFIASLWATLSSFQLPFETKGKKLEDF